MSGNRRSRGLAGRIFAAIASLNLNALGILARRGFSSAQAYVTYTHRLYAGYGLPWTWSNLPWRADMTIPRVPAAELFPEIDFTRSPELLHAFPREQGVLPHELMILCHAIKKFQPALTVELGTAEGRSTVNFAMYAPEGGEVVTVNLPPEPGSSVGYFYWDSQFKSKIKQVYEDISKWNPNGYRASAGVVFCDACDQLPWMAHEMAQGFAVVKPGGVLFRHDYGTNEGTTKFWNEVGKRLPVRHIEGTTLLCLKVETPELHAQMQSVAADFLKKYG
jgi:predicted O-methyltransferase YrrM